MVLGAPYIENRRATDPSRTSSIRSAFAANVRRRFRAFTGILREAIETEDSLGLLEDYSAPVLTTLAEMRTPGRRRFAFLRDPQKVSAFMDWLRGQVEAGILDVGTLQQIGGSVELAWTNVYVLDSYRRGVMRARYQLREAGFDVPLVDDSGGISAVLSAPIHADRLGLLYTRTFNELRGITNAMDQHISRLLAQGVADGLHPRMMARMIIHAATGEGSTLGLPISYINPQTGRPINYFMPAKQRAEILARTEVIRAHAEAQLQEFKNWGVEGVSAKAEWVTAGDARVCPDCAAMEGSRFTIAEASGMIPLHPQCRCIWIPYIKD